ncbi:MAG: membrane protein insertase YidC [Pseudomonadota bacterium]
MQGQQPQQPDDHKNLLIAVIASMAILLTWQFFFPPPSPISETTSVTEGIGKPNGTAGVQTSPQTSPQTAGQAGTSLVPGVGPGPAKATAPSAPSGTRIPIKTSSIEGSIGLRGALIDDVKLVEYHEEPDESSPLIQIFSPTNSNAPYFAEHRWVPAAGAAVKVPDADTEWIAPAGAELTKDEPLVLTWDNGAGLAFTRTISVDDHYLFTLEDTVSNTSGGDVVLYPYARIYRYGTPKIENFFIQHEGIIGWTGEAGLQELTYSELMEPGGSQRLENIKGGWIGFTDKYWATAIVPNQGATYSANLRLARARGAKGLEAFESEYLLAAMTVPNGQSVKTESYVFAGAKNVELIEGYEADKSILEFNYLVDWGWFWFITKPLYWLLHWFYTMIGNFGLAILCVTVVVKALFFPLANKAYESMAAMKRLQPEMEKLREKYDDDKKRQQQELMALYQKEKINPLAGCLPILLQIPVFFALYKVLFVSIDMRHAPFYGWITDLSAPDPTSIFNLFGLIPWAPPVFLLVGAWPILMGITMWLQMQLNPPQPDPTQQMIFNWMPVMFTFLLATFPAGLVIYWAWNNVLSLIQQYFIMKRSGTDIPLIDNVKKTVGSIGNLRPGNGSKKSD